MTSSRYKESCVFGEDRVTMTSDEFNRFANCIKTGCTFTLPNWHSGRKLINFRMCNFEARYYEYVGLNRYHVTNDTRRKICRYLAEIHKI
jgi:hypothetical protein